MGKEIERKFLISNDSWKTEVSETNYISQGYLNSSKDRTVRVRITNEKAWITIKSKNIGATRSEFEYEIPLEDAKELLTLCEKPLITKHRNIIKHGEHIWELDVFHENNEGLIIAEIELNSEEETFIKPNWAGKEVTNDARYYNSNLAIHPFSEW